MDPTNEELVYIANHIFLPPKLPGVEEERRREKDSALSRFIISIGTEFISLLNHEESQSNQETHQAWKTVHRMLKVVQTIHRSSCLDKEQVFNALTQMETNGTNLNLPPL